MFVLGGGNFVGTIISAITLIIFSRLLGPEQFGLFSSAFALMQIVVRLIDSGTTVATERALARAHASNPKSVASLLTTSAYLKTALYLFWLIVALSFAEPIAKNYLGLADSSLIRTAIILSFGTVIFEFATITFQSTGKFALVSRITIAQALGKLLGGLILLSQSLLTATSALWLYGLMPALGTLVGWIHSPVKMSASLKKSWSSDLKTIGNVAKWTAIASIAATLADNLDTLMVQSMMTLHDTGVWSAAARIAAFANLIPWTIGAVLNIRVTQFHETKHIMAYLKKAKYIALGSAGLILLAVPLSSLGLYLTVGPAYLGGTQALMLLLVASALTAMVTPFASLYYLFDKPQYYAYAGLISTIMLIVGDYFLIPLYGIIGAGWARVIMRMAVLIFTFVYTKNVLRQLTEKS